MKRRKEDGTFAKTEAKNAKVLFDHFCKVVNLKEISAFDPTILQEIDPCPFNTTLDTPPTLSEIKAALQKMQYKKSPGKNEIPTEAFKNLKRGPLLVFKKLIALFWQNDQFNPVDWQQIKQSIFTKKGQLSQSKQVAWDSVRIYSRKMHTIHHRKQTYQVSLQIWN
jgi:hypothetical protein